MVTDVCIGRSQLRSVLSLLVLACVLSGVYADMLAWYMERRRDSRKLLIGSPARTMPR